ncbi:MAG: hypothetical protein CVT95_00270 [Bacteroidetes bacterium HGW-Bacteroidetes-12]|nr:MAG: hypothetical protein CVT95_00270 [Bacteroidetes bacterium HGW-Bacteroidetes-12]
MQKIIIVSLILMLLLGCSSEKQIAVTDKKSKDSKATILSEKQKLEFDYLFHEANKERILGNFQMAVGLFARCIKINPNEAAPYYEMANIYDMTQDANLSLAFAKKAVELDGSNKWYRLLYAHTLQRSGDTENAIKQYEKLVELEPNNIDLYFDIAQMQSYIGKHKEALNSLSKVEKVVGIDEQIILQKEKIYIKLNDIDGAANEVRKLINAYPDKVQYQGILADLYLANDLPEKAFAIYQEILVNDPQNPYAHLSLYDYYKSKKEDEKAIEEAKLAFQSPDLDIDTKMQILLYYYSISDKNATLKKEAFELNKILIKVHPEEAKSYTIYADFLLRENKLEGAKENYLKAIEFDNSRFPIWNQLMFIESELNQQDDLLRDSKKAIELFPNQPIFYFFYGLTNLQKKNFQEAIDYFEIGKDFVLDNPQLLAQFYASLGDAYNGSKSYEKSDAAYEKALKIEPKNVYVLNNYSYYLSLRKEKLERAEQLSALCNELEPNQPNYQDTYAWILYTQGKFVQAKDWLEKAVELWEKAKNLKGESPYLDKKIADKKLYE